MNTVSYKQYKSAQLLWNTLNIVFAQVLLPLWMDHSSRFFASHVRYASDVNVNNTWNRSYPSATYQMIQKIISISYLNPSTDEYIYAVMPKNNELDSCGRGSKNEGKNAHWLVFAWAFSVTIFLWLFLDLSRRKDGKLECCCCFFNNLLWCCEAHSFYHSHTSKRWSPRHRQKPQ